MAIECYWGAACPPSQHTGNWVSKKSADDAGAALTMLRARIIDNTGGSPVYRCVTLDIGQTESRPDNEATICVETYSTCSACNSDL